MDYILVPHDQLQLVESFKVRMVSDAMADMNMYSQVDKKLSDHSLVMANIWTLDVDMINSQPNASGDTLEQTRPERSGVFQAENRDKRKVHYNNLPKRFRKCEIPAGFMTSEETLLKHSQLISDLLDSKLRQAELDKIYDRIVDLYYGEMETFLKEVKKSPASSRNIRHTKKPY